MHGLWGCKPANGCAPKLGLLTMNIKSRVLWGGLLILSQYASAQSIKSDRVAWNISAQALDRSLADLALRTDLKLVFYTDVGSGVTAPAVVGLYSTREVLERLLAPSGLRAEYLDDRTVLVTKKPEAASELARPNKELRLADNREGISTYSLPDSKNAHTGSDADLQEVVITAQKREERLIDVPQAVTVLTSDNLSELGATQFRDFANTVPGLDFSTSGAGFTQISMRGVTAGLDISPTVGIYVDDVPYGSSNAFSAGAQTSLDAGVFDLDRIEVLRGPQGTLYGASTMGGLLKYVTKRPDVDAFSGDVQTGVSATGDGGGH